MLPQGLLEAISRSPGGRVALILGAGSSYEKPTGIPLAAACAKEAHRQLVLNGTLTEGDCKQPDDLACVADAVYARHGRQEPMIRCLPQNLKTAAPNEGYLLAAILLRERAIAYVLTLNFDTALTTALANVGSESEVAVVEGPHDQSNLREPGVIYLHRSAHALPEEWILRTTVIQSEWRDRWEQVLAQKVLAGPVTVFAGLGSPAPVLQQTLVNLRKSLGDNAVVYQVDPAPRRDSGFFAALGLPEDSYIQLGWGEFMRELARRVLIEHREEIHKALLQRQQSASTQALDAIANRGLLDLCRVRAKWILSSSEYATRQDCNADWAADLLIAVESIAGALQAIAYVGNDGVAEFSRDDKVLLRVRLAHGRGTEPWMRLEDKVRAQLCRSDRTPRPSRAVIAGASGPRQLPSLPATIVDVVPVGSILAADAGLEFFDVSSVIDNPTSLGALTGA